MFNTLLFENNGVLTGLRNCIHSPLGSYISTLFTGVLGIVLLLTFFSTILSPAITLLTLPMVVSFNCAMCGYSITEKRTKRNNLPRIPLLNVAAILTIVGCSIVTLFYPWEPLMDGMRYLITGSCAVVFSFFGSWIAIKNKHNTTT